MTDYTEIPDSEIAAQAPINFQTMRRLRDNTIISGWEPYDGGTGVLWDGSTDADFSTLTTPDFEDGYEYQVHFSLVTFEEGTTNTVRMTAAIDGETTTGSYSDGPILALSTDVDATFTMVIEILRPRFARKGFSVNFTGARESGKSLSTNGALDTGNSDSCGQRFSTAQKARRLRISNDGSGVFEDGIIYMYRRRCNDGTS